MNREFRKDFLIDITFFLVVSLIIYFSFKFLLVYLFPFLIGLIITALVQKPSAFISQKIKVKKGTCAAVLVALTYILLFAILFFFGYEIINAIFLLYEGFSENLNYFEGLIESVSQKLSTMANSFPTGVKDSFLAVLENLITSVANSITLFLSELAASAASYAPGVLVSIVVTIVASLYIAKDYDSVKRLATGLVSDKICHLLLRVKEITLTKILKIIKGYILILLITFAELSIGFLLLKIENAVLLALLIAFLDVLPVLGTGTVLIPWGIINIILGNYWLGAGLVILYVIVLIIRSIIEPKIISRQVGLHPLITLLCIFIGLKLFGFIGLFLLPLIVILIYNLIREGEFGFLKVITPKKKC